MQGREVFWLDSLPRTLSHPNMFTDLYRACQAQRLRIPSRVKARSPLGRRRKSRSLEES
jgi:hypothetical protein